MKREVVRDFLNLPGIAGVALMDGRSRPYFCGVDQTLNFQQKEALVQGITQVVETTPDDFDSFEFQFTGHQVYIYKLDEGMVLLVLARSELIYTDYLEAIEKLKSALKEDVGKAVTTFRLIASDLTMSNQNYWKSRMGTTTETSATLGDTSSSPATVAPTASNSLNGGKKTPPAALSSTGSSEAIKSVPPLAAVPSPPPPEVLPDSEAPTVSSAADDFQAAWDEAVSAKPEVPASPSLETSVAPVDSANDAVQIELKELLSALNQLSQFTTQYLGTAVITNYWKSSRPRDDWLQNFQVDRAAKIVCTGVALNQVLDEAQLQVVREWVAAFIKRCSQVIRDFSSLVHQSALNDRQKLILLE